VPKRHASIRTPKESRVQATFSRANCGQAYSSAKRFVVICKSWGSKSRYRTKKPEKEKRSPMRTC